MSERKGPFILSFVIGSLIGGGLTLLLSRCLVRQQNAGIITNKRKGPLDEMKEQYYEEGDYCAPEGADRHYDMGKDIYYSNEEE
jgi:hypothetical protein